MSEVIIIGGGTETILGTQAAAANYIGMALGDRYDAWAAASDTQKKKSLVNAVRFINAQSWQAAYDTLAERDLVDAFKFAQYELAVLIFEDSELTDEADQGSNISSLKAGSAGITFFNSTADGADPLPPILMRLVGQYLAVSSVRGPVGGRGQSGGCRNPMSDCSDNDRNEPW